MKRILLSYFAFISFFVHSQTITPSVFNSGGNTHTVNINSQPTIYTDNIGEVFVETISNSGTVVTQGFIQPNPLIINNTSVEIVVGHVTCLDKADGFIKVEIQNLPPNAQVVYSWTPNALCLNSDCDRIDSLSAGNYSVDVIISYTLSGNPKQMFFPNAVTINDSQEPCKIKAYTGVTPNGNNPNFTIDNIENFPKNTVMIFNRWGVELFKIQGYNNRDKVWPDNKSVIEGTYFYIIDLGDGSKLIKGWLEVLN